MKFELNEKELKEARDFKDMCHKIMAYSSASTADMYALTYRYIFEPTGVGVACYIECEQLEIGISLTDYESW